MTNLREACPQKMKLKYPGHYWEIMSNKDFRDRALTVLDEITLRLVDDAEEGVLRKAESPVLEEAASQQASRPTCTAAPDTTVREILNRGRDGSVACRSASPAAASPARPHRTFYSYKGGTGRSMILANTAWILAASGYRVAVIDWDLEAPGLHRYLAPTSATAASRHRRPDRLRHRLRRWQPGRRRGLPSAERAKLVRQASRPAHVRLRGGVDASPCREDRLRPAGRQTRATRCASIPSTGSTSIPLSAGIFLEEVKRRLRAEYDYVLIDSRTGVSDTSGVCTVQMPDTLVVCFTLNEQEHARRGQHAASARGAAQASGWPLGLRVLPVPMRVDISEKERVDRPRTAARERFDRFLDWLDDDQLEQYWGEVEIPTYRSTRWRKCWPSSTARTAGPRSCPRGRSRLLG